MEIFTRKQLLDQLQDLVQLARRCPKEMMFHCSVEFSGLDPKFMELAKQYNIQKQKDAQAAMKKVEKRGEI